MATRINVRGEDVRRFILENVEKHPNDISKATSLAFGITRQAVNRHLQRLCQEKALSETGKTRNRSYKLSALIVWRQSYSTSVKLEEDLIWTNEVKLQLGKVPDNVQNIWHYAFTEMFNNCIDHSEGTEITVRMRRTATTTEMVIVDNGVGIFKKIQSRMGLLDERHAIFELSKGKLTTDPKNHSGEGIFFTSRMFDAFDILSGGVYFYHAFGQAEDWILEGEQYKAGTAVWMKLNNHTSRTTKKIFDIYSSGDDYGFNKTVVPVRLARLGNDQLISRSQAKRLLARVELFKVVMFDFTDVSTIGQAFSDEIFRVFAQKHPEMELIAVKANSDVKRMIVRAKSGSQDRE